MCVAYLNKEEIILLIDIQVMYIYYHSEVTPNETQSHRKRFHSASFCQYIIQRWLQTNSSLIEEVIHSAFYQQSPHLKSQRPDGRQVPPLSSSSSSLPSSSCCLFYILSAKASNSSPKGRWQYLHYHHGRSHVRKMWGSTILNPNRRGPFYILSAKPHLKSQRPMASTFTITIFIVLIIIIMLLRKCGWGGRSHALSNSVSSSVSKKLHLKPKARRKLLTWLRWSSSSSLWCQEVGWMDVCMYVYILGD